MGLQEGGREESHVVDLHASPGIVINTDGLTCTYSKLKLHSTDEAADSRLRAEFAGTLLHAKMIEQRPRR